VYTSFWHPLYGVLYSSDVRSRRTQSCLMHWCDYYSCCIHVRTVVY